LVSNPETDTNKLPIKGGLENQFEIICPQKKANSQRYEDAKPRAPEGSLAAWDNNEG